MCFALNKHLKWIWGIRMDFDLSTGLSALLNQGPKASVPNLLFTVSLGISIAILRTYKG